MTSLEVVICKDAEDAVAKGFNYRGTPTKALTLEKAVIVQNGTNAGNATVDLLMKDESGQQSS